jgi:hypothetical protein
LANLPHSDDQKYQVVYDGQLKKMLAYVAIAISCFVMQLQVFFFVSDAGSHTHSMLSLPAIGTISVGLLILALAFLLLVPQVYLAISIIGKFQELIILERKLDIIGFYDEIIGSRFFLAKALDRITNILLASRPIDRLIIGLK